MIFDVTNNNIDWWRVTFFLDGELRLDDRGQRQWFVGDEQHSVSADFSEQQNVGEQQSPIGPNGPAFHTAQVTGEHPMAVRRVQRERLEKKRPKTKPKRRLG